MSGPNSFSTKSLVSEFQKRTLDGNIKHFKMYCPFYLDIGRATMEGAVEFNSTLHQLWLKEVFKNSACPAYQEHFHCEEYKIHKQVYFNLSTNECTYNFT